MTQEEIRRLLGGYATDTLSERERSALFEAALDDQEVFDALQKEDTLRELLADPATREQLRAELRPAPRRRSWMFAAAGLAAALIAVAIIYWPRPAAPKSAPVQIASAQAPQSIVPPKIERPAAEAPRAARLRPQSKPRIPAVAAPRASAQLARGVIGGLIAPEPVHSMVSTPLYNGPLVRYSVLRSGAQGDQIRIEVVSQIAGNLALYRADAAGQWRLIFPSVTPGIPISAGRPYQIPDVPITVRAPQNKLRLVIEPHGPRFGGQMTDAFVDRRPRALAAAKPVSAPPLVVEIPIGPN